MSLTAPPPPSDVVADRRTIDDLVIKEAKQRARRRRRRYAGFAAVAVLAGLTAYTSPLQGAGPPDSPPAGPQAGDLAGRSVPAAAQSVGVPWCITDPDNPLTQEVIVGAGAPINAWCIYGRGAGWSPARSNYLLHHAGSTILSTGGGFVYRVADGRLTDLADGFRPSFSHDGRYLLLQSGDQCGGVIRFSVYEIATGAQIATTVAEVGNHCAGPNGIDDLGRVYVTVFHEVSDDELRLDEIRMWDTRSNQWTRVGGVPLGTFFEGITYVTADGFAVPSDVLDVDGNRFALASVEGVIDARGRFVRQRDVPVGDRAEWSPDRSLVIENRSEGVVVLPAADMSRPIKLDLPAEKFTWTNDPNFTTFQWVSPTSVLVQNEANLAYRCDVESATCDALHIPGQMASGREWGR
jgi:hypothetical protein